MIDRTRIIQPGRGETLKSRAVDDRDRVLPSRPIDRPQMVQGYQDGVNRPGGGGGGFTLMPPPLIEHVTLLSVPNQVIPPGGAAVQWGTVTRGPVAPRGFNTVVGQIEVDEEPQSEVQVDINAVLNLVLSGEWSGRQEPGTLFIRRRTLDGNGDEVASIDRPFVLGPVGSTTFDGLDDGWEVRRTDLLSVIVPNESDEDQVLAGAELVLKPIELTRMQTGPADYSWSIAPWDLPPYPTGAYPSYYPGEWSWYQTGGGTIPGGTFPGGTGGGGTIPGWQIDPHNNTEPPVSPVAYGNSDDTGVFDVHYKQSQGFQFLPDGTLTADEYDVSVIRDDLVGAGYPEDEGWSLFMVANRSVEWFDSRYPNLTSVYAGSDAAFPVNGWSQLQVTAPGSAPSSAHRRPSGTSLTEQSVSYPQGGATLMLRSRPAPEDDPTGLVPGPMVLGAPGPATEPDGGVAEGNTFGGFFAVRNGSILSIKSYQFVVNQGDAAPVIELEASSDGGSTTWLFVAHAQDGWDWPERPSGEQLVGLFSGMVRTIEQRNVTLTYAAAPPTNEWSQTAHLTAVEIVANI